MKAVILAAGDGKRMWPLTSSRPKVMLPLVNLPIMEHLILQVVSAGIREFILVLGHRGEVIREYFGDGRRWGIQIDYVSQEKQMGTADALRMAEGKLPERFLVLNGDIIVFSCNIKKLVNSQGLAIAGILLDDVSGLGVLELDNTRVIRIHEKKELPPSHMVNAGLYYLDRSIFKAISSTTISSRDEYELTDSLQTLIDDGCYLSLVEIDQWLDVAYPWSLLAANELLCKRLVPYNAGQIEEHAVVKGPVSVGKGTIIRSGSYITGPVAIGMNCEIGPNCYIRPYTSIGDGCHIGAAVEVKNSIFMSNTHLPHHNYVGDSIIGKGCNLGAGTKIANLRFDKGNIKIGGIQTGRRKLGAIIGDGVQTGINASINPGSVIGDNAFIGPNSLAIGIIPPGSRIIN